MELLNNLYTINSIDDEGRRISLRLLRNSAIYKAHFPGQPITPGVCIIKIASELLETVLNAPLELVAVKNAKFLSVINPVVTENIVYDFIKIEEDGKNVKCVVNVLDDKTVYSKLSLIFIRN